MLFYLAHGCPNCGGIISDERLAKGLPCEACLEDLSFLEKEVGLERIGKHLQQKGKLKDLKPFLEVEEKLKNFKKFFQENFGVLPSSLQLSWAKRFFLGESFAIIAPTGTGKTTFGLLACLLEPGKTLILVPTKILVKHLYDRIREIQAKTTDRNINNKTLLSFTGSAKEKELLEKGFFDIFICTQAFFHKNYSLLKDLNFSLIFVDDVDSFLKSGKNIERLFYLLGFTEKEIALALKRDKNEEEFQELAKIKENRKETQKKLIVSSATLKPKTSRAILFQNLLGFEVTRFVSTLRKVEDLFYEVTPGDFSNLLEKAYEIVKILGKGGLLFIEESYGKEKVEVVSSFFKEKGLKVGSYLELSEEELLETLEKGEIDLAIGLAHLSNPLLRGIDFPETLSYTIFLGVPKHRFPLFKSDVENTFNLPISIQFLHNLFLTLLILFEEEERFQAFSYINYLKKYLTLKEKNLSQYEAIYKKVLEIRYFLQRKLEDPQFLEKLNTSEEVFLERDEDGRFYVVVGNAQVYLQGSGRVSRLTARGLLPGLSIILVDNPKAFKSLIKRLKFYIGEEITFQKATLDKVSHLITQIREERKTLSKTTLDFKNYLIIVESPHKAKTIANFFGKPAKRRLKNLLLYEIPMENTLLSICASLGHLFNLSRREGIFGVFKHNGHYYPLFDTIKIDKKMGQELVDEELEYEKDYFDKRDIISSLRTLAYCATETFIASDPDAEGEKIAYDLFINLKPYQPNISRLEFHEITPRAFKRALEAKTSINLSKVKAQLARRVADRWVGFTLSRELWKAFNKKNLSAGRVQTPVLGWVIKKAELANQYKYRLTFSLYGYNFLIEIEDKELAKKIYEELPNLKIKEQARYEEDLSPPPPYTTDTILEEAYYNFRFSTSYTMNLLQELFELGLITYHRTDSTRISETGRFQVAKPYITQSFGEEYFYPREWSKEGAHEGIRPTHPWDLKELKLRTAYGLIVFKNPRDSLKLYDLIFRRFIASQMKPLRLLKGDFEFILPSYTWKETLNLAILEKGYDLIWKGPSIFTCTGEDIKPERIEINKIPKVFLYNQGSLIQEMKKRGLGRPSTYAEIVATLLHRHYIHELKNGSLVPTRLGKEVYQYLVERFSQFVSEEFTRELEEFMDKVESGEKEWEEICTKLKPLLNLEKVHI
ncbi:MAG: reverse gyrase [Caldimicrobium sp.]